MYCYVALASWQIRNNAYNVDSLALNFLRFLGAGNPVLSRYAFCPLSRGRPDSNGQDPPGLPHTSKPRPDKTRVRLQLRQPQTPWAKEKKKINKKGSKVSGGWATNLNLGHVFLSLGIFKKRSCSLLTRKLGSS